MQNRFLKKFVEMADYDTDATKLDEMINSGWEVVEFEAEASGWWLIKELY